VSSKAIGRPGAGGAEGVRFRAGQGKQRLGDVREAGTPGASIGAAIRRDGWRAGVPWCLVCPVTARVGALSKEAKRDPG